MGDILRMFFFVLTNVSSARIAQCNLNSCCFAPLLPTNKIGNKFLIIWDIFHSVSHVLPPKFCLSKDLRSLKSSLEIIATATHYGHLPLGIVTSTGGPTSIRHFWCHEETVRQHARVVCACWDPQHAKALDCFLQKQGPRASPYIWYMNLKVVLPRSFNKSKFFELYF